MKKVTWFIVLLCLTMLSVKMAVAQADNKSPVAVAADPIDEYIFIANKTGRDILMYDTWLDSFTEMNLPFPADVSGVTISADRKKLYATTSGSAGQLYIIDIETAQFEANIAVGHYPSAPVISASKVFVCNQLANKVTVVDAKTQRVVDEINTRYQPFCQAITPDSNKLLVGHLISDMAANGPSTYPYVSMYNTATHELLHEFALPAGASGVRGICISPDGRYAYVTHLVGRYRLPTTHIERGWVWTNAMTIMDLQNHAVVNTVLLDEVDKGAANPWPISCTEDGDYLCVATAGSQELFVIDRTALHTKLGAVASGGTEIDVISDLSFLNGMRQRIPLTGKGARSMVVFGREAYIPAYFSDLVDVVPSIGENPEAAYSVALSPYADIDPYQFHTIDLLPADADLVGNGINKNDSAITSWSNQNAYPRWTFTAPKEGNYMVFLTAAAPGTEGGTFEVLVDGNRFAYPGVMAAPTTSGWDGYKQVLGAEGVHLSKGTHTIEVHAVTIDNASLMNVSKLSMTYSELDLERVGEMLFNDGTVCYQSWLSCASCHPEGRADGLNWDLGNDGLGGSPRNVKSLLNAHNTPPTTLTGVRPHAYSSVRAGFKFIEFIIVPETYNVAADQFLLSMKATPSPKLVNGKLSEAAERGKPLFEIHCINCHEGVYFTSSAGKDFKRDVGTGGAFDVPSLIECWRTAPYLNEGRAKTLRDAVTLHAKNRSSKEIDELTEYVASIGPLSDGSSAYDAWQWVQNDALLLPDDTDIDNDGVPQLLEYFHGMSVSEANELPVQRLVQVGDQMHWQYPAKKQAGVNAMLQFSDDLINWHDLKPLPDVLDQVFDISVDANKKNLFYRVRFE